MGTFNGQLNSNEIFSALYNMIISQTVLTKNIDGLEDGLLAKNRVDGGLYGDTKLYYDTDVLKSFNWLNDQEASNLLKLYRPKEPKVQKITLDKFRQIPLTVDYYLSKRAWGTESAFSSFISVMLGWINGTKRVYDYTLFSTFIGTDETSVGKQQLTISLEKSVSGSIEDTNKAQGAAIAQGIADLFVDLKRPSRNYNDNENLKSRGMDGIAVVWNSKYYNKIRKFTLPVLFHNENLIDKFGDYVLPAEYFGKINGSGSTAGSPNKTVRSLIEKDYNEVGMDMSNPSYDPKLHIFPGDLIPDGKTYEANETYTVDDTIICKVMDEHSVPFMSAFQVGTSFFNAKSLTENHYLTWGYNTLEHIKGLPFITIRGVQAEPLGKK